MKTLTFTIAVFVLLTTNLLSQNTIDSLVKRGIEFHDQGEFDKAIQIYKKALEIDPNSSLVHYEIALSYYHKGEYETAINHSDEIIDKNDELAVLAYVNKGNCLDLMGKSKKSIRLYKKAMRKLGEHYLLSFNLGVTYFNQGKVEDAVERFEQTIMLNPFHQSSHYYLSEINHKTHQKVPSILASHFFLLCEPTSKRSLSAYYMLIENVKGNIESSEDGGRINVNITTSSLNSEFTAAELLISMREVVSKTIEDSLDLSDEEVFEKNTKSLFDMLGEMNQDGKKEGIYWEFYIPFFYDIAQSDHFSTYCNWISQSDDSEMQNWIYENRTKVEDLMNWIDSYDFYKDK